MGMIYENYMSYNIMKLCAPYASAIVDNQATIRHSLNTFDS